MKRLAQIFWGRLCLVLIVSLVPEINGFAHELHGFAASSGYEVIDAVNALRASHGLPAYATNSILMGTAQAQAEYMASIGSATHTGPGGSTVTQRILAAGYPLAGDLSLGGFRSENIVMGTGMTASGAVEAWTSDSIHLHTMLSPDLQEIGAGVAEADGMVFYVIDCARPTAGGVPPAYTPGAEASYSAGLNEIIVPVTLSTPDANGEIVHEVRSGQTLWQIAVSYGVKIDEIRQRNQLPGTYLIQPGDKLLIKQVGTATPAPPTWSVLPTLLPVSTISTSIPRSERSTPSRTAPTATGTPSASAADLGSTGIAVGAIMITALVAAALVAWAGRSRPV